jgi:hypothetical protein
MRPRRTKVLVSSLLLVLAMVVLWLNRSAWLRTEPVYQGKALTSWVGQWRTNQWRGYTDAEAKKVSLEAEQAILSIKDEAIPFLLDLMRGQEPSWKKKLRSLTFGRWHTRLQVEDGTSKLKNLGAVGLAALGTNAAPAVPSLIALVSIEMNRTPPDQESAYLPVFALGFVGQAGDAAIPILIQCLTNKFEGLQLEAAHRLGQLGLKPEIVVPGLMSFLESQRNHDGNATRCAALDSGLQH